MEFGLALVATDDLQAQHHPRRPIGKCLSKAAPCGLLVGGVPAVLLAAYIVKSLDLTVIRWLVLAVVLYTAIGLIRAARRGESASPVPSPSRAAGAAVP